MLLGSIVREEDCLHKSGLGFRKLGMGLLWTLWFSWEQSTLVALVCDLVALGCGLHQGNRRKEGLLDAVLLCPLESCYQRRQRKKKTWIHATTLSSVIHEWDPRFLFKKKKKNNANKCTFKTLYLNNTWLFSNHCLGHYLIKSLQERFPHPIFYKKIRRAMTFSVFQIGNWGLPNGLPKIT